MAGSHQVQRGYFPLGQLYGSPKFSMPSQVCVCVCVLFCGYAESSWGHDLTISGGLSKSETGVFPFNLPLGGVTLILIEKWGQSKAINHVVQFDIKSPTHFLDNLAKRKAALKRLACDGTLTKTRWSDCLPYGSLLFGGSSPPQEGLIFCWFRLQARKVYP